jgi:hypothetical protein
VAGIVIKTLPGTVMEFDTPVQVVLNILACGFLLWAVVDALRRPVAQWRQAQLSKWWVLVVVGGTIPGGIHGVYVPLGPVIYAVVILPQIIAG